MSCTVVGYLELTAASVQIPKDYRFTTAFSIYSGPPLIRMPLLPNNSVLIREVSFGEREHYIHS